MANPEHLAILKQGVEAWNRWREENPSTLPDLSYEYFSNNDFAHANLTGADLTHTRFRGTNLWGTDLIGANLKRADLMGVQFRWTDLTDACLKDAYLVNTIFHEAVLRGADFSGSAIGRTFFLYTDLSEAKGLETVIHHAPSAISMGTIHAQVDRIPESFLRGCGLSDWEIENVKLYNPDLSNEEINNIQYKIYDLRARRALQISPLFISYSHADGAFVDAVEKRLTERGVRFWRDVHHAVAGRLERQIDQAINFNDVVLLVLSEHSTDSDWVEHEARKAREKEKQTGKDALCPVALDDSWKTCRWPDRLQEQITEYNILDFSNWQDDSHFQKMFGRLLEGLNLFYK